MAFVQVAQRPADRCSGDDTFQKLTSFSRKEFAAIFKSVSPAYRQQLQGAVGTKQLASAHNFFLLVARLRSARCFSKIANRYSVDKRSYEPVFAESLNIVYQSLRDKAIQWPNEATRDSIASGLPSQFHGMAGFVTVLNLCTNLPLGASSGSGLQGKRRWAYRCGQATEPEVSGRQSVASLPSLGFDAPVGSSRIPSSPSTTRSSLGSVSGPRGVGRGSVSRPDSGAECDDGPQQQCSSSGCSSEAAHAEGQCSSESQPSPVKRRFVFVVIATDVFGRVTFSERVAAEDELSSSEVFRRCALHKNPSQFFRPHEFLLGDATLGEAGPHVRTPHRAAAAVARRGDTAAPAASTVTTPAATPTPSTSPAALDSGSPDPYLVSLFHHCLRIVGDTMLVVRNTWCITAEASRALQAKHRDDVREEMARTREQTQAAQPAQAQAHSTRPCKSSTCAASGSSCDNCPLKLMPRCFEVCCMLTNIWWKFHGPMRNAEYFRSLASSMLRKRSAEEGVSRQSTASSMKRKRAPSDQEQGERRRAGPSAGTGVESRRPPVMGNVPMQAMSPSDAVRQSMAPVASRPPPAASRGRPLAVATSPHSGARSSSAGCSSQGATCESVDSEASAATMMHHATTAGLRGGNEAMGGLGLLSAAIQLHNSTR